MAQSHLLNTRHSATNSRNTGTPRHGRNAAPGQPLAWLPARVRADVIAIRSALKSRNSRLLFVFGIMIFAFPLYFTFLQSSPGSLAIEISQPGLAAQAKEPTL